MRCPVVELSDCIGCEVCVEVCPNVFCKNASGYIEVVPLETYPESEVDEAAKNCPADCILWGEG